MITRRRFVKLVGGAAALAALPIGCGDNDAQVRGLFFDAHQWATIDLVTGAGALVGRGTLAAVDGTTLATASGKRLVVSTV